MYSIDLCEGELAIYHTDKGNDPVLNIIKSFSTLHEAEVFLLCNKGIYKRSWLLEQETTKHDDVRGIDDLPSASSWDYSLESHSVESFHDLVGLSFAGGEDYD